MTEDSIEHLPEPWLRGLREFPKAFCDLSAWPHEIRSADALEGVAASITEHIGSQYLEEKAEVWLEMSLKPAEELEAIITFEKVRNSIRACLSDAFADDWIIDAVLARFDERSEDENEWGADYSDSAWAVRVMFADREWSWIMVTWEFGEVKCCEAEVSQGRMNRIVEGLERCGELAGT